MGEFFGEMGITSATHERNAYVIAKEPVTCLIFSPGEPTKFAGRGAGAVFGGAIQEEGFSELGNTGLATHALDVREYILKKVSAISAHRTQYPITEDMLPREMLNALFGYEYFVRIAPRYELEEAL